jgi:hypothetical protein
MAVHRLLLGLAPLILGHDDVQRRVQETTRGPRSQQLANGFALSEATGRFEGIDVDAEFDSALELLARVVAAR